MVFSQSTWKIQYTNFIPAGIYLLKTNGRNTRTRCEICSKQTVKISERRQCRRSGVFIVNFEHISKFVQVFLLLTLNGPKPIRLLLLLAFMNIEKSHHFYRNGLNYSFLFSLLKERSCVLFIILTTRYYIAFSI